MKREVLQNMNRNANEKSKGSDTDKSKIREFWHSSSTVEVKNAILRVDAKSPKRINKLNGVRTDSNRGSPACEAYSCLPITPRATS